MSLQPTHHDLPESSRALTVPILNQQLVTLLDLKLQTKQAHWNIKGPNFIAVHEMLD